MERVAICGGGGRSKVYDVWPDAGELEDSVLLTPDGIGIDDDKKRIHLVDVARTMDHEGDLLARRGAKKTVEV